MSNRSQSERSKEDDDDDAAADDVAPQTLGEQHLESALGEYRSRYSAGHEDSIDVIERAVCEVVDELKRTGAGPVAVILAVKSQLIPHPASHSIHPDIVRRCIERFYE